MTEGGECRTVEDHFPLDSTLWGKERGRVYRNLDAHGGGPGQTTGGLERTRAFDAEEHASIDGGHIAPAVLFYELRLEPEQPPMGTGVGGSEGVCAGERDAGPGSPVVHSLYAARETDDGGRRGVGHWGGDERG